MQNIIWWCLMSFEFIVLFLFKQTDGQTHLGYMKSNLRSKVKVNLKVNLKINYDDSLSYL